LGDRVDQEHSLIASRMAWLMAMNGLFFAAIGLVVSSSNGRSDGRPLALVIVGMAIVGSLSNLSALYSHYWASRAIKEAEDAARWALDPSRLDEDPIKAPVQLLRLFGRDPKPASRGGPSRSDPWHPFWPLNRLFHPWHLMPLLGCLGFSVLPLFVRRIELDDGLDDYSIPWIWVSGPLITVSAFTALFFVGLGHEMRSARTSCPSPVSARET
jgi:hypothetical protein